MADKREKSFETAGREYSEKLATQKLIGFLPGYDWESDTQFQELSHDLTTREIEFAKAQAWNPYESFALSLRRVVPDMTEKSSRTNGCKYVVVEGVPKLIVFLKKLYSENMPESAPHRPVEFADVIVGLETAFHAAVEAGDTENIRALAKDLLNLNNLKPPVSDGVADEAEDSTDEMLAEFISNAGTGDGGDGGDVGDNGSAELS